MSEEATNYKIDESIELKKFDVPEGTELSEAEMEEMQPVEVVNLQNGEIVRHTVRDEDGNEVVLVDLTIKENEDAS